jgi:subtilisin family serine protease
LLGLWQATGQANPYIVLFQQNEIGVGSLSHNDYQNVLKSANAKNLTDLANWMNTKKVRSATPVQDLWLVRGAKADLTDDAAAKLKTQAFVAGVYADEIRHLVQPVGEMKVSAHYDDTTDGLWGLTRIGIPQLRAAYPSINGSGVRVGVIDTGIQAHHPEFQSYDANWNLVYTPVTFQDFVNGMTNPYDDHGHGTHVSGTIAGQNVGIAPGVSLIVGKALNASGEGYDSWLLAAMQWMMNPTGVPGANDWAQVVSSSWGADIGGGAVIDITQFLPYQRAIESWIAGGIVPVFAAGNSGSAPNGIPGGLPDAIAIGAIDNTDAVAYFSSRGPNVWQIGGQVLSFLKPDLSAPGVNVTSAFPGNLYATWSGTSMATPHVTGSVALALQANPKLTYSGIKAALYNSVDQKIDVNYGYGILNAYHLVQNILSRR